VSTRGARDPRVDRQPPTAGAEIICEMAAVTQSASDRLLASAEQCDYDA